MSDEQLAPEPGTTPSSTNLAAQQFNRSGLRITMTIAGERVTKELYLTDLGPADDLEARKQIGVPVMPFFQAERFGTDALLIIWWMACRKSGDFGLQYRKVLEQFPTWQVLADASPDVSEITEDEQPDAIQPGMTPEA